MFLLAGCVVVVMVLVLESDVRVWREVISFLFLFFWRRTMRAAAE